MIYEEFIKNKAQKNNNYGFDPLWIPDFLFDFQKVLVEWAIKKGRSAIFADCGLGKTPLQLVWAENIVRKTNQKVLIVAPLAVSTQTVREGEKFGIECKKSDDGSPKGKITITNYERLHLFDQNDYQGVVCDESSILKNFAGTTKKIVTEFLRTKPYRLLCTATAAPNDYTELGTTSEALGELGYMDMLSQFFKNDQNTCSTRRSWATTGSGAPKWRFKRHAESIFWKWVSSWARVLRKPSDLGFDDGPFVLPPLTENQTVIENQKPLPGELFIRSAKGLKEQRQEMNMTLVQRCEKVAEIVENHAISVTWCNLNKEGDLLERLIPGAVQVSGSQPIEKKEDILRGFSEGSIKRLVTKPKIAGYGLNWQHCAHTTWFPSHSFEQYYQGIRRFWRFGQTQTVIVDIITTQGGLSVLANLQKKAEKADKMFNELVSYMNNALKISNITKFDNKTEVPKWL